RRARPGHCDRLPESRRPLRRAVPAARGGVGERGGAARRAEPRGPTSMSAPTHVVARAGALRRRLPAPPRPPATCVRTRPHKDRLLRKASGVPYYNGAEQDFASVAADSANVAKNLRDYVSGFSPDVQRILGNFEFDAVITRLVGNRLLYKVVARFEEMEDLE